MPKEKTISFNTIPIENIYRLYIYMSHIQYIQYIQYIYNSIYYII